MKFDHVAKLDQHDQKRQQHDVHHAPLAQCLHQSKRKGFVFSVKQFEEAQLEQEHNFCQWKDN